MEENKLWAEISSDTSLEVVELDVVTRYLVSLERFWLALIASIAHVGNNSIQRRKMLGEASSDEGEKGEDVGYSPIRLPSTAVA